jgi:hypothetical protein
MDKYRKVAQEYIKDFYNCDNEQDKEQLLTQLSEEDLEVLKYIILNTTLYKDLYNRDSLKERLAPLKENS